MRCMPTAAADAATAVPATVAAARAAAANAVGLSSGRAAVTEAASEAAAGGSGVAAIAAGRIAARVTRPAGSRRAAPGRGGHSQLRQLGAAGLRQAFVGRGAVTALIAPRGQAWSEVRGGNEMGAQPATDTLPAPACKRPQPQSQPGRKGGEGRASPGGTDDQPAAAAAQRVATQRWRIRCAAAQVRPVIPHFSVWTHNCQCGELAVP